MSATDPKVAAEVSSLVYSYLLTVDRDLAAAFKRKTKMKNQPDDLPTITEVFVQCSMSGISPAGTSQQSETKVNITKSDSKKDLSPKKSEQVSGKSGLYKQKKASGDSESGSKDPSKSTQITSSTPYVASAKTSLTKTAQASSSSTSGSVFKSPKAPVNAWTADKVQSKIDLDENQTGAAANHDKDPPKPPGKPQEKPNNSMKDNHKRKHDSSSSSSDEEFEKQQKKLDIDKLAHVKKTLLMSSSDSNTDEKSRKSLHTSPHKMPPKMSLLEKNAVNNIHVSDKSESLKPISSTPAKVLQSVKRKYSTSDKEKTNIDEKSPPKYTPLKRKQSTSDSSTSDVDVSKHRQIIKPSKITPPLKRKTSLYFSEDYKETSKPTSTPLVSPNTQAKISLTESTGSSSDEKTEKNIKAAISTHKTLVKSNFISTKMNPSEKKETGSSNGEERSPKFQNAATPIITPIGKKNKHFIRQQETTDDSNCDTEEEVQVPTLKSETKQDVSYSKISAKKMSDESDSSSKEEVPKSVGKSSVLKISKNKNLSPKLIAKEQESNDYSNSDSEDEELHVGESKLPFSSNKITTKKSSDETDSSSEDRETKIPTISTNQKVSPRQMAPSRKEYSTDDSDSVVEKESPKQIHNDTTPLQINVVEHKITSDAKKTSSDESDSSSEKKLPKSILKTPHSQTFLQKKIPPAKAEKSTDDSDSQRMHKPTLKTKTKPRLISPKKSAVVTKKYSDESDSSSTEEKTRNIQIFPAKKQSSTDDSDSDSEIESPKHTDKIQTKSDSISEKNTAVSLKKFSDESDTSIIGANKITNSSTKSKVSPKKIPQCNKQDSIDDSVSDREKTPPKQKGPILNKVDIKSAKITFPLNKKSSSNESDSSSEEETANTTRKIYSKQSMALQRITPDKKQESTSDSDSDTKAEETKPTHKELHKPDEISNKITAFAKMKSSDESDSSSTEEKTPNIQILPAKKQTSTDDSDSDSEIESSERTDKIPTKSDATSGKNTAVSLKKFRDESDTSIDGAIKITNSSTKSKVSPKKIPQCNKQDSTDDSVSDREKTPPKHKGPILNKADIKSAKITFPLNKKSSSNESDSSSEEETANTTRRKYSKQSVALKIITPDKKQQSTSDSDSDTKAEEKQPTHKEIHKPGEISNRIMAFAKIKSSDDSDSDGDEGAPKSTQKITTKPKVSSKKITLPKKQHSTDTNSHTEEYTSKLTKSSHIKNNTMAMNTNSSDDSDSSVEERSNVSQKEISTKSHTSQTISSARNTPHKKDSSRNSTSSSDEASSETIKSKQKLDKVQYVKDRSKSKRTDTPLKISTKPRLSSASFNLMNEKSNLDAAKKELAKPSIKNDLNSMSTQDEKNAKLSKNKHKPEESFEDLVEKNKTLESATLKRKISSGDNNIHPEDELTDDPVVKKQKFQHRGSTDLSLSAKPSSSKRKQWKSSANADLQISAKKFSADEMPDKVKSSRTANRIGKKGDSNKCPYCKYTAPRHSILKIHVRKHTGVRPHKCKLCDKTFTVSSNLYRHEKSHSAEKNVKRHSINHTGKKFKCSPCLRTFKTSTNLYRHLKSAHSSQNLEAERLRRKQENTGRRQCYLECAHCGYVTVNRSDLKVHLRTHAETTPYKCTVCEKRFTQSSNLWRHLRKMHAPGRVEKKKPVQCDVCGKLLSTKLKRHFRTHTARITEDEEKLEKVDSNVQKISKKELHDAEKLQIKENKYVCIICDKHLASAGSLRRHSILHTRRESEGKSVTPLKKDRSQKINVTKRITDKSFDKKPKHEQEHTSDDSPEEENVEPKSKEEYDKNSYICNICNKTLATKSGYTRHMKNHSSQVNKAEEGIDIRTPTNNERSRIDSTDPTDDEKIDDSSAESGATEAKQGNNNSKWANYLHPTTETHECTHCRKTLSSASSLKRHSIIHTHQDKAATPKREHRDVKHFSMKHIKTDEKKDNQNVSDKCVWKCSGCEKTLSSPLSLRRHLLQHIHVVDDELREETFPTHAISRRTYDTSEEEFITKESDEEQKVANKNSLKCQVCDKLLSTPSSLKRHLNIHNRLKTEPVERDAEVGRKSDADSTPRAQSKNNVRAYFSGDENYVDRKRQKDNLQHINQEKRIKENKEKRRGMKNGVRDDREDFKEDLDNAARNSKEEAAEGKKDQRHKLKRKEEHDNIKHVGELMRSDNQNRKKKRGLMENKEQSWEKKMNTFTSEVSEYDRGKDKSVIIKSDGNYFKCLLCNEQFAKASKLMRHSKIHEHLDSEPTHMAFPENVNLKKLKKSIQESTHNKSQREKELSSTSPSLKRHSKTNSKDVKESVTSEAIDNSQCDNSERPSHDTNGDKGNFPLDVIKQRRKSTNEKSFSCPVCEKLFVSVSNLNRHSKIHLSGKSESTREETPVRTKVKNHSKESSPLRNQSNVSSFECTICNKVFSTAYILKRHSKTHTKDATGSVATKTRDNSNSDNSAKHSDDTKEDKEILTPGMKKRRQSTNETSLSCSVCEKLFVSVANLNRHSKIHLNGKSESTREESPIVTKVKNHPKEVSPLRNQSNISSFECTICNKVFSTASILKRHSKTHTKDATGSVATKTRDNSNSDNSAKDSDDAEEDKEMLTPGMKKRRKSTNEKSFSCPVCKKPFVSVSNLNRHSKIHTSGQNESTTETIYPSKAFSHLRHQSDVSPFECTICEEVFSTTSNLKRHSKTHRTSVTEDVEHTLLKKSPVSSASPDKKSPSKKRKLNAN